MHAAAQWNRVEGTSPKAKSSASPRLRVNKENLRSYAANRLPRISMRPRFATTQLTANAGHGNRWNAGAAPPL
jgi:hypothetical protein